MKKCPDFLYRIFGSLFSVYYPVIAMVTAFCHLLTSEGETGILERILLSWAEGENKKIVSSLHTVSDLRQRPPLEKIFFMGTWSSEVINFHGCMSQQVDKS